MSEKLFNELRRIASFLRSEHHYGREQTVQNAIAEIERLRIQVERQRKALNQAELALDQAQDCINAETPEDITFGEAEDDTISKIREAMRTIAAVTSEQS